MKKKKPLTSEEARLSASIRGLTRYYHYMFPSLCYTELCAICHRGDKKQQYKRDLWKKLETILPK